MKIVYVDMDGVLVNFETGIARLNPETKHRYEKHLDEAPGIFGLMDPMPGALEAFDRLSQNFDVYILSTAPWRNPSAWSDKISWVHRHMGESAYKRLILSHHKELNHGDFLIDDRTRNGADRFRGEHIHFGTVRFPDWPTVERYLAARK